MRRLCTPRGIATTIFTAFFVISGVSGARESATALAALLIISPVIWWLCWRVLAVLRGIGGGIVRGGRPNVRVGRQWQSG
jgi:hypothetical protein